MADNSSMSRVATEVCAKNGHHVVFFPSGVDYKGAAAVCTSCGMTIEEIRKSAEETK